MRILAAVGLALGVLMPVSAPAAATDPGADCGTPNDTPPAIFIPNNTSCNGTHDGEAYSLWSRSDSYGFAATLDDAISIGFTRSCDKTTVSAEGGGGLHSGTFTYRAPKSGPAGNEEDPQFYALGVATSTGFEGSGCAGTTNYNVGVYVIPNTKPTASFVAPPSTALPGDPTTVVLAGADADGNLRSGYLRIAHPGYLTQNLTAPFDAAGRATFAVSFPADATVTGWADDNFAAVSAQSVRTVTLLQDDCNSEADAGVLTIEFPISCRGHLAASMADDLDTYNFEVPPGADRIAIDAPTSSGPLASEITVTPPAGDAVVGTGPFFLPADAGIWQVGVARIGDTYGGYDLSARSIGPAAPPAITANASPSNPHQWEPATLTFSAADPNAERVRYQVNWGDGSAVENFPSTGTLPSGTGGELVHAYAATSSPRTATVTATNQEGRSAATPVVFNVRAPNDVCGGTSTPAMDAPGGTSGWTAAQTSRFSGRAPRACDGELGYTLAKTSSTTTIDTVDGHKFFVCAAGVSCGGSGTNVDGGRPVRIRVATGSGLSARVRVGISGSRIFSANASPGMPGVITLVATPHVLHEIVVERTSGKGSYDLDVTLDPIP